jgi:hypothetical protein
MMNLAVAPTALYTPNMAKPLMATAVSTTPPAADSAVGDTFIPSQPMVAANRDGVDLKKMFFGALLFGSHLLTACEAVPAKVEQTCNAGIQKIEQQQFSDRFEQQLAEKTGQNTSQVKLNPSCPPTN